MIKIESFSKIKNKIKKNHFFFFFLLWSKQCNDMKTFFFLGGVSQEDILGLAISLIFDQFSIL